MNLMPQFVRRSLLLVLALLLFTASAWAQEEHDPALEDCHPPTGAAEKFFISLDRAEYAQLWQIIDAESRQGAVEEMVETLHQGEKYPNITRQEVLQQFERGVGEAPKVYWKMMADQLPMKKILNKEFVVGKKIEMGERTAFEVHIEDFPEFGWVVVKEDGGWHLCLPKG